MVKQQPSSRNPWFLETIPLLVFILIAAHVLALGYWIYCLATEKQPQKQPQRTKKH